MKKLDASTLLLEYRVALCAGRYPDRTLHTRAD